MNLRTLSIEELRAAAEYSARKDYEEAARGELFRRVIEDGEIRTAEQIEADRRATELYEAIRRKLIKATR